MAPTVPSARATTQADAPIDYLDEMDQALDKVLGDPIIDHEANAEGARLWAEFRAGRPVG